MKNTFDFIFNFIQKKNLGVNIVLNVFKSDGIIAWFVLHIE